MAGKVVVIIHGAGKQPDNYPAFEVGRLTAALGYQPAYVAARYDQLVQQYAVAAASTPDGQEAVDRWVRTLCLRTTLEGRLRSGARPASKGMAPGSPANVVSALAQFVESLLGLLPRGMEDYVKDLVSDLVSVIRVYLQNPPLGLKPTIQDCVGYLLGSDAFRKAVQAELIKALDQAVQQGYDQIILASHSLGTVVAFDVLSQILASYPKPISTWFTMGSPLRWLTGLDLHSGNLGQITYNTVRFWHNLYDTTDLIASPLAPAFPAYNLYDDFVDVNDEFPDAHDYWRNDESVRIIADALR